MASEDFLAARNRKDVWAWASPGQGLGVEPYLTLRTILHFPAETRTRICSAPSVGYALILALKVGIEPHSDSPSRHRPPTSIDLRILPDYSRQSPAISHLVKSRAILGYSVL